MKLGALVLSMLLTPLTSVAEECHLSSDNSSRIQCLNSYAKRLLSQDAPAGVRDRYVEELQKVLQSAGIERFDLSRTKSLDQVFSMVVPETRDSLDASEEGCFDFTNGDQKALDESIRKQMKEVGYFLKTYHAWSLGNTSSHLFQIRRVEICSSDKKSIQFSRGILRVHLASGWSGMNVFTAKDILKDWNSGDIVFGPSLGFFKKKIAAFKGETSALIKQKLRPTWLVLNPIGEVRYQLRMALHKKTGKTIKDLLAGSGSAQDALSDKSQELGLTPVSLTAMEAETVAQEFQSKLQDTEFLNQVLEQILVATNGGSHSVTVVDKRVNIGLIAVKNNKQIGISVGSLFASPLEIDEELNEAQAASASEVTAQLEGKNIGLVAVDLFDQVAINVVPPNLLKLIEKISLKEAFKKKDPKREQEAPRRVSPEVISI